jgi:hypothetical protein
VSSVTRMRGHVGRTLLVVLGLAALVAGLTACAASEAGRDAATPRTSTDEITGTAAPWAAAAEVRFRAEAEAAGQGVADHAAYFARDLQRVDLGGQRAGLDEWQQHLRSAYGVTYEELAYRRTAVDRTGAVVESSVSHLHGFEEPVELLEVRTYRRDGVATVVSSIPLDVARASPTAVGDAAFEALEEVGAAYLAAWGGSTAPTLDALYAVDARLVDDLEGIVVEGRDAIARHRATTSVPNLRLAALPISGAPARYLDHRVAAAARHLTLVTLGVDERDCPGRVVAELELDTERRIVAERRFHAIEDARRCIPDPPGGWWDHLDEPEGGEVVVLALGDGEVTVRGASLAHARLLRWAYERFETAGLLPPRVASVTFADATGRCAGVAGRVTPHAPGSADILLCLGERAVCRDEACTTFRQSAQQTVLHELAHAWALTWLDAAARERYRDLTASPSWSGADDAWADRAGERAAEILMWGLSERPTRLARLGGPPCAQVAEEFRQLTGVEPICGGCES